jgi:GDP-D-mannose dehydratase
MVKISIKTIDFSIKVLENFNNYNRNKEIKKVVCNIRKISKDLHWKPDHKINNFIPKLLKKELF